MDYRTPTDLAVHDLLKEVLEALGCRKMGRLDFQDALGKLRDAKKVLDCKQFGCPMGLHSSECLCTHHVPYTEHFFKYKRKVA